MKLPAKAYILTASPSSPLRASSAAFDEYIDAATIHEIGNKIVPQEIADDLKFLLKEDFAKKLRPYQQVNISTNVELAQIMNETARELILRKDDHARIRSGGWDDEKEYDIDTNALVTLIEKGVQAAYSSGVLAIQNTEKSSARKR